MNQTILAMKIVHTFAEEAHCGTTEAVGGQCSLSVKLGDSKMHYVTFIIDSKCS